MRRERHQYDWDDEDAGSIMCRIGLLKEPCQTTLGCLVLREVPLDTQYRR